MSIPKKLASDNVPGVFGLAAGILVALIATKFPGEVAVTFLLGPIGLIFPPILGAVWSGAGDLESWLRVLAAGALLWHPIHEQRLGFRYGFNAAVKKHAPARWISGENLSSSTLRWREHPLSRRQNALQFVALSTVFPVLALVGPWWVLWGLLSFYMFDQAWTHAHKRVPGFCSAQAGLYMLIVATWFTVPEKVGGLDVALALASVFGGAGLLALPWWMAYRRVKGAS